MILECVDSPPLPSITYSETILAESEMSFYRHKVGSVREGNEACTCRVLLSAIYEFKIIILLCMHSQCSITLSDTPKYFSLCL